MKTFTCLISLILWLTVSIAQDNSSPSKSRIEFGLGIHILGPNVRMASLMREHDFDRTTDNLLFSGTTRHPSYIPLGPAVQLSYFYSISPTVRVGLQAGYTHYFRIQGAHQSGGSGLFSSIYLNIKFASFSAIPCIQFNLSDSWELQAGPGLLMNMGKRIRTGSIPQEFTRYAPAFQAGINKIVIDKRKVFGKIFANFVLAVPGEMGPFTTSDSPNALAIPESSIGFGHLKFGFVFGLK